MKKLKINPWIYHLVIAMFVFSLCFFLFVLYIDFPLDKKEIDIKLEVGDVFGFDVNDTVLTFGTIVPGSSGQRNITIHNDYGFSIIFEFDVEGEVERFLVFREVVSLDINESKTLEIKAVVSSQEELNSYSGKMIVKVKRDFW